MTLPGKIFLYIALLTTAIIVKVLYDFATSSRSSLNSTNGGTSIDVGVSLDDKEDNMKLDEEKISRELGVIEFSILVNVSSSARARFLFGLKTLATFWYDLAEEQFMRAQKIEPTFGMAYWGQAMCHMKFLWATKNSDDACEIFEKMESHRATVDGKNVFYINSTKTLFGCDHKDLTEIQRLQEFSRVLKDALQSRPRDGFLSALYALSLMEQNYHGAHSPQMAEARNVLKAVLNLQPRHPFALHAYLHAYDYPGLAHEALDEARMYREVVTSSVHGLHMPTHIFNRLGMWEEAIRNERAALKVGNDFARKYKNNSYSYDAENRYHSLEHLQYYLLQTGNRKEAKDLLDQMHYVVMRDNSTQFREWHYRMAARQWLETRHFNTEVLKKPVPFTKNLFFSMHSETIYLLAYGLSILKKSVPAKYSEVEDTIRRLEEITKQTKPLWRYLSNSTVVAKLELQSQMEVYRGAGDKKQRYLRAFEIMEKAVKMQDSMTRTPVDPILPFVPSWEFYGEMIISSNFTENTWPEKAVTLFKRTLEQYPKRSSSLLGLVRVYLMNRDCAQATRWYDELKKHWKPLNSSQKQKQLFTDKNWISSCMSLITKRR